MIVPLACIHLEVQSDAETEFECLRQGHLLVELASVFLRLFALQFARDDRVNSLFAQFLAEASLLEGSVTVVLRLALLVEACVDACVLTFLLLKLA